MKVKDIADYIDYKADNLKILNDRGLSTEYHKGIIKGLKLVRNFINNSNKRND